MQEEKIDPVEPHPFQAFLQAAEEIAFDVPRRRRAQPMFGGDPDAVRQFALEGGAHHPLGLAIAIAGRHVEEGDAAVDGRSHGRHAFLPRRLAPELADTAAAKRQRAHRP